jgi:uncharacterized membrane protein YraQ (UPF0718 family)
MKKLKKRTSFKEDAGKILLDLGKLIFGGIFIGGILRGNIPHDMLIISGIAAAMVLIVSGFLLGIKEKKNGDGDTPPKQE